MATNRDDISVICFDLGGVVLRICRTWAEGCAAAGVAMKGDPYELARRAGQADGHLHNELQTGRITAQAYAERFSALTGGVYSADEVMRIHDAWVLGEYPGMADLIGDIHRAGLETAILSNTSHEHWITFDQYPAFIALRNRHGSHLLGLIKPDEAIYRAFEQATGFGGASILFFDDLEDNIDAAQAFGWNAVRIDHAGSPSEQIRGVLEQESVLTTVG
jgi:HAD superfamily hydrolase (TIGR01509 family)